MIWVIQTSAQSLNVFFMQINCSSHQFCLFGSACSSTPHYLIWKPYSTPYYLTMTKHTHTHTLRRYKGVFTVNSVKAGYKILAEKMQAHVKRFWREDSISIVISDTWRYRQDFMLLPETWNSSDLDDRLLLQSRCSSGFEDSVTDGGGQDVVMVQVVGVKKYSNIPSFKSGCSGNWEQVMAHMK